MTGPDDYGRDELPKVPPSRARLDPVNLPTPAPQRGSGMARDKAIVEARRIRCVYLRMAGHTYEQIAEAVGYTDRKTARDAVMAALDGVLVEGVEQMRELEGMALLQQRRALWPLAMGEPAVKGGVAEDGSLIEDRDAVPPDVEAHRVLVRIADRYAKLNGLDAPTKIDLTGGDIGEQLGDLRAAMAEDGSYSVTDLDGDETPQGVDSPVDGPPPVVEPDPDDPLEGVDLPAVTVRREGRIT